MSKVPFLFLLLVALVRPAVADELSVNSEQQWLRGKDCSATLKLVDDRAQPVAGATGTLHVDGECSDAAGTLEGRHVSFDDKGELALTDVRVVSGSASFRFEPDRQAVEGENFSASLHAIHPAWALVPPLLSILIALTLRQVLLALALGVFAGAFILSGNLVTAFVLGLEDIIVGTITDPFRGAILLFTAALGGMVAVMARAGGTQGLVDSVRHFIKDARSAQLATGVLGLLIFFDDYANTLLVGNTMRPVTDRMRVSREKLSYLVDSTAAPVATVAWLSTWVGYQVGLIADGLESVGREGGSAYAMFMQSVPYASYSWLALVMVFALILARRDFGPMLGAERRARSTGAVLGENARPLSDDIGQQLQPGSHAKLQARLAIAPVLTVLLMTLFTLWYTGERSLLSKYGTAGLAEHGLRDIFSAADPAISLLLAVTVGCVVAISMAVGARNITLNESMDAWVDGAKSMVPALIILVLAWSIGDVCVRLRTADVVVDFATGNLMAQFVPTVTFLIAAFLAFSTGTSWGSMAILMPIVIPLATGLSATAGLGAAHSEVILLSSIAAVLSGSVFGDHCSPISDTTIMSSMASGSDHVDHVRTQLPYAFSAGLAAVLFGTLPAGFGISPWFSLPVGIFAILLLVRFAGQRSDEVEVLR